MKKILNDVLIIGSGFGAAPPALRLAKAGARVTILEKGPAINPYQDFRHTQHPEYLLKYLKSMGNKDLNLNYVEGEGGGSSLYEMLSFRAPSMIFDHKDESGTLLWPEGLNRQCLDPYYDVGEKMLKVEQIPEEKVPKSGQVFQLMMNKLGYSTDRARYAAQNCQHCGRCITGCVFGAKQSLLLNYLPEAKNAGAQLVSGMEALYIKPLSNNKYLSSSAPIGTLPYRFEVTCKPTGEKGPLKKFVTKVLILAGGTLGTAKLLLKSKKHLRRLSSQVGKHIVFNASARLTALLPDWCPDGDMFSGRSHPGIISYQFLESKGIMLTSGKALPLSWFGITRLSRAAHGPFGYWGKDHVNMMKSFRRRAILLAAYGHSPTTVQLVKKGNDEFELSTQNLDKLQKFYKKGWNMLTDLVEKSGGEVLNMDFMTSKGVPYDNIHMASSHHLGSCRMATDKKLGVVNQDGEVFGYPDMYITDGSVIPSSLIVNPSLTILANSERITEKIVKRAK